MAYFEVLGGGSESACPAGLQYRAFHHTEALNMQTKRLLDDREVFDGDRLFDAQGRSYAFVEHSGDRCELFNFYADYHINY